jgi:hypothetical protein
MGPPLQWISYLIDRSLVLNKIAEGEQNNGMQSPNRTALGLWRIENLKGERIFGKRYSLRDSARRSE